MYLRTTHKQGGAGTRRGTPASMRDTEREAGRAKQQTGRKGRKVDKTRNERERERHVIEMS